MRKVDVKGVDLRKCNFGIKIFIIFKKKNSGHLGYEVGLWIRWPHVRVSGVTME